MSLLDLDRAHRRRVAAADLGELEAAGPDEAGCSRPESEVVAFLGY